MTDKAKKIVIIGATSGIGFELCKLYIQQGVIVGIAGRREEKLKEIQKMYPDQIFTECIDITKVDSPSLIQKLIDKVGDIDVYIHCAGIGYKNPSLDRQKEIKTVSTNCMGFTQSVLTAYHYFEKKKKGQIVVISSIAGTKGLGIAPAYSATKRMQNSYIDALDQLSRMNKSKICFTDIRPGFVKTAFLDTEKSNYPLMMDVDFTARKIYKAIEKRTRKAVIDWKFAVLVFFWNLIPNWIWRRLSIKPKSK